MTEQTVRDKLFDGIVVIAIGTAPLGFGIALAAFHGAVTRGPIVFALTSLPLFLLGAVWVSRKVTFSPGTLSVTSLLGQRVIQTASVGSIRFKRGALVGSQLAQASASLVVSSTAGITIAVDLRSREIVEAARSWLAHASETVLAEWHKAFAAGQAISFGKRVRLAADVLEDGKTRIQLREPFAIEEIPAGPTSSPLLRVSQNGERIVIDGSVDNYLPLRDYLRRAG